MTSLAQPRKRFRAVARTKLGDEHTQQALDIATARLYGLRTKAWGELGDVEELRERGREIRTRTVADLDRHLETFATAVTERGGVVHRCATAEEARRVVVEICRNAGARVAAKSKSMASEEIGLNEALEEAGVKPVETDLGEYILQLAGEHPVHIVAPAIEKMAEDVARLLSA
ncbi:MAG: LUD domain-containing protein, partial [Actinomycetota bacterium]|nr:LUD domain-containing protein [Actinomycetota bacterium]